ncbi:MAG: Dipeptide transport system permease protein DppC [uncultured Thermomicrobiales bacterium]|uniref:Dipeptide transport system permease protein DppC n=1 Tax=uncultured Thermomicrobiales bacterium TaxID=1645740 RepID=A0A6J4UXE1_9BACT|nr:MAG: Dipeptide transport system permease protein DppC [uncultured Thermomicrobiales bacterium]
MAARAALRPRPTTDDPRPTPLRGAARLGTPRSLRGDAWRRFRRNHLAIAGAAYLVLLVGVAAFAPAIAPQNPVRTDVKVAGAYRQAAWVEDANPKRTGSWEYPLGTDSVGRDVLSRLVYGARVSLLVGFLPAVAILAIGVPIGLVAGYLGGLVDGLLMRITDVVYAFPALLFFIVMQVALGETRFGGMLNGLVLLLVTLSVLSWTGIARVVRGATLELKEAEFVLAARSGGAGIGRVIGRHVLPNALAPVIVAAAFLAPGAIVAEAILGYLGIGIRPDVALDAPLPSSWGTMIFDGYRAWQSQAWMLIAPSLAVALTTLACTFVGDGLRDALDVREGR